MANRKNNLEDLVEYIKKNLKKGYTKESLRWALVLQGYSRMHVENAIKKTDEALASQAPILKTKPIIRHEIIEPKGYSPHSYKKPFWKRLFGK